MNAIDVLGWALLNFLWQGLLIAGAYAALRARCAKPHARYALGVVALGLCALAPILTLWWLWPRQASIEPVRRLPDVLAAATGSAGFAEGRAMHRIDLVLPWLVGSWCAGIVLLGTRSVLEWWQLASARRTAIRVDAWSECVELLAARFGIRRPIDLLATAAVQAPTLLGVFKPAILLPTALLLRLPPAQLELILAHELCHVRRWDYLANLAQVVLETLLFYHPAVHWLSARVRADRELCCDQAVLEMMDAPPRRYAQALAELAEAASHLAPAASGGVLVERIEVLLAPRHAQRGHAHRAAGSGWLPLLSMAALLLLAFGVQRALEPSSIRRTATAAAIPKAAVPHPEHAARVFDATTPAGSRPAILSREQSAARVEDRTAVAAPPRTTAGTPAEAPRASGTATRIPAVSSPKGDKGEARPRERALEPFGAPVATQTLAPAKTDLARDLVPANAPAIDPVPDPPAHAPVQPASTFTAASMPNDPSVGDRLPDVAAPRVTHFVAPMYPPGLEDRAVHGRVDLQFRISSDGSVQDVSVVSGDDHTRLAQAAISALRQWRFAPESAQAGHVYRQAIDFDPSAGGDVCRTPTGSHICRRDLGGVAGDDADR